MNLFEGRHEQKRTNSSERSLYISTSSKEGSRTPQQRTDCSCETSKEKEQKEPTSEPRKSGIAPVPSASSEKRLQRVLGALSALARQAELRQGTFDGWWAQELRKILQESEKSS